MRLNPTLAFACLAVCAALSAAPASAWENVLGVGKAHDCFVAAKTGIEPQTALGVCDAALANETLTLHDRAATFVNRGAIKVSLGKIDDAMSDYNAGLAISPGLGDGYVDRGAALILMKRYDEALADIGKGMQLGLTYPHIGYYNRAVAEELTGQFKASYYDFKHVLELEPNFTRASDQLKNFTVTTVKSAPPAG